MADWPERKRQGAPRGVPRFGDVWAHETTPQSTIATALEQHLLHRKLHAFRLDGDNVRFGLNKVSQAAPWERSLLIRFASLVPAHSTSITLSAPRAPRTSALDPRTVKRTFVGSARSRSSSPRPRPSP